MSWFCDSCEGDEAGDRWVLVERAHAMLKFLLLREYGIGSIDRCCTYNECKVFAWGLEHSSGRGCDHLASTLFVTIVCFDPPHGAAML